jgi:putative Ca2+/H+ antiporter (TMEM165/GDT1 family)
MIGQGLAGLWTKTVLTTYLYSLPLVFLAIVLGLKISRKIPAQKFSKYVYVMLLALGIILLIKVIAA